jgi:hypothetical protein
MAIRHASSGGEQIFLVNTMEAGGRIRQVIEHEQKRNDSEQF